ncbi:toxin-activating lysine-acyltransferase [Ensifer adhaerens]|uniref:toxin-activating lysine-acyltransferase n=1 Tax=Ensifer adhaerens TaxID=106592 RepID=UPI001F00EC55|nr:toxin-activating lysine-acyltransferase [Ensifer adhaerens]MDF8357625.1 toxin-activating lysine-acyltransferase [Ensifer adhaerens]
MPRYKHQSLSDLAHRVIEPLVRDRIVVVSPKSDTAQDAFLSSASVAVWAIVSEEVDAKIVEQTKAGAFPIRLKPEDWTSGEIVWLLDVIAPSREMATGVLANFNRVAKQDAIKIHPLVAGLVDAEVLQKLARKIDDDSSSKDLKSIN